MALWCDYDYDYDYVTKKKLQNNVKSIYEPNKQNWHKVFAI
jgi:hypothetical protein